MRELARSRAFKIMIAAVLLLLILVLYTASTGGAYSASLFGIVSTPMQQISESAVTAAGDVLGDGKSADELRAENEQLRGELDQKNNDLIDYYKIKAENEQYRQYLELKSENQDFQFVDAVKIGSDPNEYYYAFTINKGTIHGVKKNDPVITSSGLVGYVSDVGATYAKVKTILDATISVGCHSARTFDGGVISGTVDLADKGYTKMRYISNQHQMEVGDLICTSGLGGVYPYGLPIGKIMEIKPEEHDISLYALIQPIIDVRTVSDVFVITHFEGQGEVVREDISPERSFATGQEDDMTVVASNGASSPGSSGDQGESDSESGANASSGEGQ